MIYIQESLAKDEHIVRPAFYHWIYVAHASLWASILFFIAILIMLVGAIYSYYPTLPPTEIGWAFRNLSVGHFVTGIWQTNIVFRVVAFMLIMAGLIQFLMAIVVRATTEIAVTNHRLILKRGFISRNVHELRVENIESVEVEQSVLGRILHYGDLQVFGTGVGEIDLPPLVADPIDFRRAILKARESVEAYTGPMHA